MLQNILLLKRGKEIMIKKKLQRLFAIVAATTVLTTNFAGVLKVSATELDLPKEY